MSSCWPGRPKTWPPCSGWTSNPSMPGCSAGSRRCRSTVRGTPTWSPRSAPACRRPWPWPAATSTASGYLRVSGLPGARSRRSMPKWHDRGMAKLDYDALNSTILYLMFSVFSVEPGELGAERDAVIEDATRFFKQQEERGVVVRGLYDVAGVRADAALMIW